MKCLLCGKKFKIVTNTHLKAAHDINLKEYKKQFPSQKVGFLVTPNLLSKKNPKYLKWKKSLKKRKTVWCKNYTKETHPSLMKLSQTMKRRKIDNFKKWREKMKKIGKIKSKYPPFPENEEVAELIGLVLGDGNLYKHERTERLTISFNGKYSKIIERGKYLIENIFQKKTLEGRNETKTCSRIWIYEKYISQRLGIPTGAKKNHNLIIPKWIWKSRKFIVACLIGLFNAEGSYSVHLPTGAYNLQFSNTNTSLLKDVHQAIKMLKYNPNLRINAVRLRRKKETEKFIKEISFLEYRS